MSYQRKHWRTGDFIYADNLNNIEEGIEDLQAEKATKNDIGAVASEVERQSAELGRLADQIAEAQQEISDTNERLEVTPSVVDLASVAIDLDTAKTKLFTELSDLSDRVLVKAETNDLAAVASEADRAGRVANDTALRMEYITHQLATNAVAAEQNAADIRQANERINLKVDRIDFASLAAECEDNVGQKKETEAAIDIRASRNDIADLAVDIDTLSRQMAASRTSIANMVYIVNETQATINTKVPKPGGDPTGTAGQVLGTNGDGTTFWTDPTVPTDEQIGGAVSDWLDDHPEATTTVADGSITSDKLSGDLLNEIENGGGGTEAQVMSNELMLAAQRLEIMDKAAADGADYFNSFKRRLIDFSSYFTSSDGFGFVFFTDPHNMAPRGAVWDYDSPQYQMLSDLHYIRSIYENTPARYVLCGGDWINSSTTLDEAMMMSGRIPNIIRTEICSDAYTVPGNHDTNEDGSVLGRLDSPQLAKLWFGKPVGYYTLEKENCLCLMLDASWSASTLSAYHAAELEWVGRTLLENTKQHLFAVGHILCYGSSVAFRDALCSMFNAFNMRTTITINGHEYNFSSVTGTMHFCLAGHYHNDGATVVNNIPIILTRDFGSGRAVDCCYADFETSTLHMVRIGAGSSRDLHIIPDGGYAAEAN